MKRAIILLFTLVLIAVSMTTRTKSYVRSTVNSSNGAGIAWKLTGSNSSIVSNGRIQYEINQNASKNVPFAQAEPAIKAAFQAWEDIPTSAIAFTELPASSITTAGNDGHFPIFWLENSDTTSDGLVNVTGALAVTSVFRFTSGPNTGEIIDANMVFNGQDNTWSVSGAAGAFDIEEVATHEAGHSIGLDHSPLASATMFPRTGENVTKSRTLSIDDQIVTSIIYPSANFASTTGKISGTVSDGTNLIFGAHVVALDPNGIDIASALTQKDGTYTIEGLNSGNYTIYAHPLNSPGGFFSIKNLNGGDPSGFYSTLSTNFLTSNNLAVSVNAGSTTNQNIIVTPVTAGFSVDFISIIGATLNNFQLASSGTTFNQGQTGALLAVGGLGLPNSGTPLSIAGVGPGLPSGITVHGENFGILSNNDPEIHTTIDIAANAPPGPRDLVVTNGSAQKVVIPGGMEVLGNNPIATISSLNPNSATPGGPAFMLTVNGSNFVYGSVVQWNGSARLTFFLNPNQLTASIPASDILAQGTATVTVLTPTPGGGMSTGSSFTVNPGGKANQTITFPAIPNQTFGGPSFSLGATASSGLAITYSVTVGQSLVSIAGSTLTILGAGNVTIQADQVGNASFNSAPSVSQSFTINKANQTISFGAQANKASGDPSFTLSATASSGLGVTFSVTAGQSFVNISGNTVTILGPGNVTIQADQAGNVDFNAAPAVPQSFTINKASQAITFGALANQTFGNPSFTLSATASSGLGVTFSVTAGQTLVNLSGNTVTILGAGNVTIQADQAGNANFNAAPSVPQSFTINKANQTITFGALANKTMGDPPFNLSATSTSGLAVTFTATVGGTLVNINGNTVTLIAFGSVTIQANQVGNANFNAAPPVPQSFTIAKGTALLILNTPTQIADGTPKVATVTTTPPGVSGVTITYNGSATPPTAAGTYAVSASLNNPNFTGNVATGSLRIVSFSPSSQSVNPGTSGSANTPPASSPGISATLNHAAGGVAAGLTVGVYSGNPSNRGILETGGGYGDVKVTNSNSGDTATINYYYPASITGTNETQLQFFYFTGSGWALVKDGSGNLPTRNTTDNLDGTTSGGRFTITVNNTNSSPRVSQLTGTFFTAALAIMGDCDLNGVINVSDLLFMANSLAGNVILTPTQKGACDVFNDNKGLITVQDLLVLANFLAGNTLTLPVNTGGPISNPGDTVPEAFLTPPLDQLNLGSSEQWYRARLNEIELMAFFDRKRPIFDPL